MRIAAAFELGLVPCVSGFALAQTGSGEEAAIRRVIQQYDPVPAGPSVTQ